MLIDKYLQAIIIVVYTTIFGYIIMTRDLFGYNNLVDCKSLTNYAHFIIQKVGDEVIINFDTKKFATYVNVVEELVI